MANSIQPILLNGHWTSSTGTSVFQAVNPMTEELLPGKFPVSPWEEIETAINAAAKVSRQMRGWPGSRFADFLECYAKEIEARAELLIEAAHAETGLPVSPRLKDGELPRTTSVELRPDEYSKLNFGCDGSVFGISVADPGPALVSARTRSKLLIEI